MQKPERFPFLERIDSFGQKAFIPSMPIRLRLGSKAVDHDALLDTGATINVLPFSVGKKLGADWDAPAPHLQLAGNLSKHEARGILIAAEVAKFNPVNLVFAWTKSDTVPLILGQMNFFNEFDVCFFGSKRYLEIRPKS